MSKFSDFPILKTNSLLLRNISESDAPQILFLRSNDIVTKFIERPKMKTLQEAKQLIFDRIKDNKNKKIYYWAITQKEKQELIGTICFWNFSEDRLTAEIGYDLNPEYFNKGIMSEAIKEVIDFGFKTLKLSRIEAFTQVKNTASINLLEKNLFVLQTKRIDKGFPKNRIFVLENSYL